MVDRWLCCICSVSQRAERALFALRVATRCPFSRTAFLSAACRQTRELNPPPGRPPPRLTTSGCCSRRVRECLFPISGGLPTRRPHHGQHRRRRRGGGRRVLGKPATGFVRRRRFPPDVSPSLHGSPPVKPSSFRRRGSHGLHRSCAFFFFLFFCVPWVVRVPAARTSCVQTIASSAPEPAADAKAQVGMQAVGRVGGEQASPVHISGSVQPRTPRSKSAQRLSDSCSLSQVSTPVAGGAGSQGPQGSQEVKATQTAPPWCRLHKLRWRRIRHVRLLLVALLVAFAGCTLFWLLVLLCFVLFLMCVFYGRGLLWPASRLYIYIFRCSGVCPTY